jgi:hypothetical protein
VLWNHQVELYYFFMKWFTTTIAECFTTLEVVYERQLKSIRNDESFQKGKKKKVTELPLVDAFPEE